MPLFTKVPVEVLLPAAEAAICAPRIVIDILPWMVPAGGAITRSTRRPPLPATHLRVVVPQLSVYVTSPEPAGVGVVAVTANMAPSAGASFPTAAATVP